MVFTQAINEGVETKNHTEGTSNSLKQIEIRIKDSNNGDKEGIKRKDIEGIVSQ